MVNQLPNTAGKYGWPGTEVDVSRETLDIGAAHPYMTAQ
jgi:hypothetical protein